MDRVFSFMMKVERHLSLWLGAAVLAFVGCYGSTGTDAPALADRFAEVAHASCECLLERGYLSDPLECPPQVSPEITDCLLDWERRYDAESAAQVTCLIDLLNGVELCLSDPECDTVCRPSISSTIGFGHAETLATYRECFDTSREEDPIACLPRR